MRMKPKKKILTTTQEKFPILISYAYLRKAKPHILEWWASQPEFEIIVDSGAYTAWASGKPIDVDDYIAWLKDWGHRFWNYFALDVVKEPKPTRKNLYRMWDAGLKPVPVHVFGEDESWMNELYKHTDFIATVIRQQMGDSESYIRRVLKLKMEWAAGRKVHWFGYVNRELTAQYKPFSCDGSRWNFLARYRRLELYLGDGRWMKGDVRYRNLIRDPRLASRVCNALERLGFTGIMDRKRWSDCQVQDAIPNRLTAWSWMRYAIDVRRKFGSRVFLATVPTCGWETQSLVHSAKAILDNRPMDALSFDPVPGWEKGDTNA